MPKRKLHINSGKRKGLRLKRGEVLTICDLRISAEDCGDPFSGNDVCGRCVQDQRYPALAAKCFRESEQLHPTCVIWWRREEPQEMCSDCCDSMPSARGRWGHLLWSALSRDLPPDALRCGTNTVQQKMREHALDRDECCYLCGGRVKHFRMCRPEVEHVNLDLDRDDPSNWRIAHSICNNLKGGTSGREYYDMLVADRIIQAERVAARLLGRTGRCASAAVPYSGSMKLRTAWDQIMRREQRGAISNLRPEQSGDWKFMAGDWKLMAGGIAGNLVTEPPPETHGPYLEPGHAGMKPLPEMPEETNQHDFTTYPSHMREA